MLVIVNTETGDKVGAVVNKARWPDGAVTHAPKAGLRRGPFRIVEAVESVTGDGPLIETAGEAFDGGNWVVSKVRSYPPLEDMKAAKLAEVDAERDRRRWPGRLDTGLGWSVDFRHPRDEATVTGLSVEAAVLDARGETGAVLAFRGADNVTRRLTAAEMVRVGQAVRRHVAAVHAAAWAIKDAIGKAGDRAALDAIAVAAHAAWPAGEP